MTRVAVLLAGVALLAAGCGGRTARSAAEVAPADVRAFVSLPVGHLDALTRRALALAPDGPRLQAILDRAGWARAAHERVDVAELADGRLVAFAQLKDTKQLDAAGLAHGRARGWTVFAPTKSAVTAARAKRHLVDTRWYAAAARAAGRSGTTFVAPGWVALAVEPGTVRRSTRGRGRDVPTAGIPADAIAAAGARDGAALLRSPFAAGVQGALGFPLDRLAPLAPGAAVVFVRPGIPIPGVTLLAEGGSVAAALRAVRTLAPDAPPAVPERMNGAVLEHVSLGATDLYYGRAGRTLVFTDDPGLSLEGRRVPSGDLPGETSGWLYVDGARARAALQPLTAFEARGAVARMQRQLAGVASLVEHTTHARGVETTTILLR